MAEIKTNIVYDLAGGQNLYPIPFPYASIEQVGIVYIHEDGRETVLNENDHYKLIGNCIRFTLDSGHLKIWLKENLDNVILQISRNKEEEEALSKELEEKKKAVVLNMTERLDNSAKTFRYDPDPEMELDISYVDEPPVKTATFSNSDLSASNLSLNPIPASVDVRASEDSGPVYNGEDLNTEKDRLLAEFRNMLNESLSQFKADLTAFTDKQTGDFKNAVLNASNNELENIRKKINVENAALPRDVSYFQEEDWTGTIIFILPENLEYISGQGTLYVYKNGLLQTRGIDYEEPGDAGVLQRNIIILKDSPRGAVWRFVVLQANSTNTAQTAAYNARIDGQNAAKAVQETRTLLTSALDTANTVSDNVEYSMQWAKVSEESAEQAYNYSVKAAKFMQETIWANKRPGVAAIRSLAELGDCICGLYIVNPQLSRRITPFYAIKSVKNVEDIHTDGIYYICDPASLKDYEIPDRPMPDPNPKYTGDADDWLPCPHNHALETGGKQCK